MEVRPKSPNASTWSCPPEHLCGPRAVRKRSALVSMRHSFANRFSPVRSYRPTEHAATFVEVCSHSLEMAQGQWSPSKGSREEADCS